MVDIIKQYKDLRYTIKQSGWDIKPNKLDKISHKDCKFQTGSSKIVKEFIFKYCA